MLNRQFIQEITPLFYQVPMHYVGLGEGLAPVREALVETGVRAPRIKIMAPRADKLAAFWKYCDKLQGRRISVLHITVAMPLSEVRGRFSSLLACQQADLVYVETPLAQAAAEDDFFSRHGYLAFGSYVAASQDADGQIVAQAFVAPGFAERHPGYQLIQQLHAAKTTAEHAKKELRLANERLDLLASALRKERVIYQKQIWRTSKRIKSHLSYRLGSAIVNGSDSVLGSLTIPKNLLSEYRSFKQEKRLADQQALGSELTQQLNALSRERGHHGLVAHIEKLSPEERALLDDDSFGHHIVALSNAFQFEKCVAEFEKRYPPSTLKRPRPFEHQVIRAYTRSLLRIGRADDAEVLLTELVRRYPHQADYSSLLGYVLAGHKPGLARSSLRTAIMLGSKTAHTDVVLLYRTLLLERLPLKEAWGDVVSVLDQMSTHKFAMEAMDFLQSTMKLQQGRQKEALRSLNSAMARNRLAPLALWKTDRPFGIDNLTVPLCQPGSYRGPLVSVLMTTHNSAEFLDTAMRSVLEQTYADLELIVIDDCSTDSTREKLAAWAEYDQRVVVLHNTHNVGTYGSKNLGLLRARGKFITCHDSDDWSHPQKIAFQVMRLRKTNAMACYSRWVRIDERGFFEAKRWGQMAHANPSSLLYHRSVIDAIGFYDTVRTGADTEFQHRIVNRFGASSVFETPTTMAFGRSHSDSLTRSSLLGFDEFGASPYRQAYWAAWGEWHLRAMKESPESLFIDFPPKDERAFDIPAEIAVSSHSARLNVEAML